MVGSSPAVDSPKVRGYGARVMGVIVVLTTVGTEEQANLISRELVERRHACCVNILPGIRSVYRWQGKICRDGELMLLIKSNADEFDALAATIRELHSYDVPEILAFDVAQGDADFLSWLGCCTDKTAEFDDEEDDLDDSRA